ncbi:ester cyclase [Modestobacter sp. VKM Ac-2978]|uniref:ester cyclase n=1 Tax=Modestobacter sp. VKM Ac-2978 TaxID=3004132 RepID=UPI0022AA7EC7|nr:ester cyclase [Modestobacter sp. VKM Ac-2978]MCZ2849879.1 ester cyclase [Modestobacter sp. VKM Ac-2978]
MGNDGVVGWIHYVWDQINKSAAQGMHQFFTDDYVRHASEADYSREEFVDTLRERHQAFPDLVSRIDDVIVDGDRLAYRWSSTGHHEGPYLGVPPTGKLVTASGITISALRGGKIAEEWASWNKVSVLHSLGVLPIFPPRSAAG